ncbi:hypothetical protein GCM10018780_74010 [Streptomyces lanatus]|nr:hypothetical protein GCM10018780_74010 [Streptomyces lanatus]
MRLVAGWEEVGEQGGAGGGSGGDLVVGEHPPLTPQPRPVVAPPRRHEFRDRAYACRSGLHGGAR